MIPYRDTIPCRYTPWITWALIAVNVAFFLYTGSLPDTELQALLQRYGLVPARYAFPDWARATGFPERDYAPFITSMFLHGGWLHLVMNAWLLWIFGDNVEDRMGGVRFLAFYLVCGLFAGALQVYFNPDSAIPTIGASGAVAGVMGAFYFLYPHARIVIWVFFLPLFVTVPAVGFLGAWVMFQLYQATTGLAAGQVFENVAWWGHLGGFIAGMLIHRAFLLAARDPERTAEP